MDYEQAAQLLDYTEDLIDKVDHLTLALDSIYMFLGFTIALTIAGYVIYLVLKPLKIFTNGGFI